MTRTPTSLLLFIAALSMMLTSACSFDLPPGLDLDSDGVLVPPGARDDGGEVRADMDADLDLEVGADDGPDTDMDPLDMRPEDMDPEDMADMDEADMQDMGPDDMADMDEADMPDLGPGGFGESCAGGRGCQLGLECEVFGADEICTARCRAGCPDGLVCFDRQCTPRDYCEAGIGPGCDSCDKCSMDAECFDLQGPQGATKDCVCKMGFMGDGYGCVDQDECNDGTAMCDPNASCINEGGGFSCVCKRGFMGDGFVCVEVDPCATCAQDASCDTSTGTRQCVCDQGYMGDGATQCDDIDECTDGTAMCPAQSTCMNTDGGFSCVCNSGFVDDPMGGCADVNECANGTAMCDPIATCTNTEGSFMCACPRGTQQLGNSCVLYSSCAEIKQNDPSAPDGNYFISTLQGALQVRCDMTTDMGVGYTMVRFDDPTLAGTQGDYAAMCASYGMEIITPRTESHLTSITTWNMGPPNIVNITPTSDGAKGLGAWRGRCQNQDCSFFVSSRASSACRTPDGLGTDASPLTWTGGALATSCREYFETSATPAATGIWEIDPDGAGADPPYTTICDMMTDGGGWTLAVISSDDNVDTWTWNRRTLWTTDRSTVGSIGSLITGFGDYKNLAIHQLPLEDLLFRHSPSTSWASYHDVGNGTQPLNRIMGAVGAPNCDTASGYPKTAGPLLAVGDLCSTDLFFHPGDYDGNASLCPNLGGPFDQSTYGPAWSTDRDDGCPFDDPARASFGANHDDPNDEFDARGWGAAQNLNLAPGNGFNFISMSVRDPDHIEPSGDNLAGERLILTKTAADGAGPSCQNGSYEDRGDDVEYQGFVICAIN